MSRIYDGLRMFNDITAPIGFIITIGTFFLARSTKIKLEETKEIALFSEESTQYQGRLQAIKLILEKVDSRFEVIPENIMTKITSLISEIEHNYPILSKRNKTFSKPIKQFKKLRNSEKITYLEFIGPFNALCSLLSNRKDLK